MRRDNEPYILVFGASVVDIFGFSCTNYRPYNSTPGKVKVSFGGVCRNIAENMARVGVSTKFISILGNDENGHGILENSKRIGYDMQDSLILEKGGTPTYMAILDEKGEMVSAIADMKSIDDMSEEFIDSKADIFRNSQYVVLDTDNAGIVEYILKKFAGETRFILDPVSAAKADTVKHLVKYFHTIKPNRHEAEVLAGFEIKSDEDLKRAGEYFLSQGVKNVFISLDEEGIYYNDGVESGKITASDVKVLNVTGAGDAFVAGLCYGYVNALSMVDTVKYAVTMSTITIAHEETIHPKMTNQLVDETMKMIKWTEIQY